MSKNPDNHLEFFWPNYLDNGRTTAKYRRSLSTQTVSLNWGNGLEYSLIVSTTLEALNRADHWVEHPRLYISHRDPDAYTRNEGEMIFILADSNTARIQFQASTYQKILFIFSHLPPLTRGTILDIKPFPK